MTEMTSTATLVPQLSERLSEPTWLREMRKQAWEQFAAMPSPKLEKTDLSNRTWELDVLANTASAASVLDTLVASLGDAPLVHVRDGQVVAASVPAALENQGVVFMDLHKAVQSHADIVKAHLGTVVPFTDSKWAALNTALWHGGAFLYVPRNVVLDAPVHFIYEESDASRGATPRVLVIGEENSAFSFVEIVLGSGSSQTHSHVLEVVAKQGAQIHVSTVNQYKKGPTHCSTRRAVVHKDAAVDWVFGDIGDGFTVALVESDLRGDGSRSSIHALGIGYGRQHLDLTASMLHSGRYSTSDIVMHGVLRQKANSIYRSSTHIFKNAAGAGSEQHDRMLMLEKTSRADAIPMLLIDENDVQRCGHAASVGRIDENQIYYLMSRGIPKTEATRMVIWGYLQPTVEAIPSEGLRTYLSGLIDKELA